MIEMHQKEYGFLISFIGEITQEEVIKWESDCIELMKSINKINGCIYDYTKLDIMPTFLNKSLYNTFLIFKEKGLERTAVVLSNSEISRSLRSIAKQSGDNQYEKYIDATEKSKWEYLAIEWIQNGIDLI